MPTAPRVRVCRRILGLVVALTVAGCTQSLPGEPPPSTAALYFPGAIVAMPDGRTVYVANTNFDQRYDTGWLTAVDLLAVDRALESGGDIAQALQMGVKVPALATAFALSPARQRAYLSHRGSGLLSVFDIDNSGDSMTLSCGDPCDKAGLYGYVARSDCDRAHLFDVKGATAAFLNLSHQPERENFDDPSALVVDGNAAVWTSFLGDGRLAVLQDKAGQSGLSLRHVAKDLKANSLRDLLLADDGAIVGVGEGSRGMDGRQALVTRFGGAAMAGKEPTASHFWLADLYGQNLARGSGAALRRVCASPKDGGRLFLLSRSPDALLALRLNTPLASSVEDTATGETIEVAPGPPQLLLEDAVALPESGLADLTYVPRDNGDVLVASSLTRGALFVFALHDDGSMTLAARIRLAGLSGPLRMQPAQINGRQLLLVTAFFNHALAVVDLTAASLADATVTSAFGGN